LINLAPKQEIDEEWEKIKIAIADAAREVIQTQGNWVVPQLTDWTLWRSGQSLTHSGNLTTI
jgi:hypothetical protein